MTIRDDDKQIVADGPLTDRLLALLTLATRKPGESVQHLSNEKMQAFVQGTLDDTAREEILAHINDCEQCRQDWLVLSEPGRQMRQEPDKKLQGRQPTITEKVIPIRSHRERTGWMTAIGFAMAASLLAIVFWPVSQRTLLPENLDELYQIYYQKIDQEGARLARQLSVPLQEPSLKSYGFGALDETDAAMMAFAAGLWQGSEDIQAKGREPVKPLPLFLRPAGDNSEMVDPHSWQGTEWEEYYSLGRWIVLLRTGCVMSVDEQRRFSNRQRQVGLMLSDIFRQKSEPLAQRILEGLKRVGELLDGYKARRDVSALCRGIEEETEQMIILLTP